MKICKGEHRCRPIRVVVVVGGEGVRTKAEPGWLQFVATINKTFIAFTIITKHNYNVSTVMDP